MVPLDGSDLAECVLPHVKTLALATRPGGIILVRVVEPFTLPSSSEFDMTPQAVDRIETDQRSLAEEYVRQTVERFDKDSIEVRSEILYGFPADVLADYAGKNSVDLIVLATHGRSGIGRWLWGSVADRLLRSACVPIMMIRAPGCGTLCSKP
jgi:nucleotide-binding universal stress UspA family protein